MVINLENQREYADDNVDCYAYIINNNKKEASGKANRKKEEIRQEIFLKYHID